MFHEPFTIFRRANNMLHGAFTTLYGTLTTLHGAFMTLCEADNVLHGANNTLRKLVFVLFLFKKGKNMPDKQQIEPDIIKIPEKAKFYETPIATYWKQTAARHIFIFEKGNEL